MRIKKFITITTMAMALMVPMESLAASESAAAIVSNEYKIAYVTPRYSYVSDCGVMMVQTNSGLSILTEVVGYNNVTKITGTTVLYKINSNGQKSKVTSWALSADSSTLRIKKTTKVDKGTYVAIFTGKVTSGGKTESITLESASETIS